MSFLLPFIAPLGNNADTRVASLHVMNGVAPTRAQLTEVEHVFNDHTRLVGLSLAGYHVEEQRMSDGSIVRIVSNSGQHDVMLWPAPQEDDRTPVASAFFAVPDSDTTNGNPGWSPKLSGLWKFRGKTEPPPSLKKQRILSDASGIKQHPGNLTWWSEALVELGQPVIVSWYGRATRYGREDYYGTHRQALDGGSFSALYSPADPSWPYAAHRVSWRQAFKTAVWTNGVRHRPYRMDGETPVFMRVLSAALKRDEDDKLWLYIISVEGSGQLALYRGQIDVYRPTDVEVAQVCTIPFTISDAPYSGDHPHWETLFQPMYFNASCTKAVGLVAVVEGSTLNPQAAADPPPGAVPTYGGSTYMVRMIELDVVTQATTFDGSHGYGAEEHTHTSSGLDTAAEAGTTIYHHLYRRYGGVDFVGDVRHICLLEYERTITLDATGSYVGGANGSQSREQTVTARTRYRAYLEHSGLTLAQRDSGTVQLSTLTWSATQTFEDPGYSGTASGTWVEQVTDELLLDADVVGGDLRHGFVTIHEHIEAGESNVNYTLRPIGGHPLGWAPAHRTDAFGIQDTDGFNRVATGPEVQTVNSDVRSRRPVVRMSAWRNGVELAHPAAWINPSAPFTTRSILGHFFANLRSVTQGNFLVWPQTADNSTSSVQIYFRWPQRGALDGVGGRDTDSMRSFYRYLGPPTGAPNGWMVNPFITVVEKYVNTAAFSFDGLYGFFNIGAHANAPTAGAFLIDAAVHTLDASLYTPGTKPGLASPVFLEQVPIP
jgi:hypothetical protein